MNTPCQQVYWRDLRVVELDCGRPVGWNPVIAHGITVYRRFDQQVGQFRPLVHPVTQLVDPFGELNPHTDHLEPRLLHFLASICLNVLSNFICPAKGYFFSLQVESPGALLFFLFMYSFISEIHSRLK